MPEFPIQVHTLTGSPIRAGNRTVIPHSQALSIRLPVAHLGFIWNRPLAVTVREQDGSEQNLAVLDFTRLVLLFMFGLGFLGVALIRRIYHE